MELQWLHEVLRNVKKAFDDAESEINPKVFLPLSDNKPGDRSPLTIVQKLLDSMQCNIIVTCMCMHGYFTFRFILAKFYKLMSC